MKSEYYHKRVQIVFRILLHAFLIIGSFIMAFPFIWMLLSAFKPSSEIISIPIKIFPVKWTLSHFIQVFTELDIPRAYINSVFISLAITILVLFSSAAGGYLFAKLKFKCKELLFFYILISLMMPSNLVIIPLFFMFGRLGLLNSYIALIIPFAMSSFGIFLLRQFISGIPDSYLDSARIDGATDFKIYRLIIIPLAKPALSVIGILTFIWSYDELIWPLVVVNTLDMRTLPLVLAHFSAGASGAYPGQSMAASILVILPMIIIYLFFQKDFIKGMTMVGLKY